MSESRGDEVAAGTRASLPARVAPPALDTHSVEVGCTSGQGCPRSDIVAACSAAVEELKATRALIDALEKENVALTQRLETEKHTTQILAEMNNTRKTEAEALRVAVAAKNDTIAAKDAVIASQTKLIDELKRRKTSPWRRLGDILLGAGVIAVLH